LSVSTSPTIMASPFGPVIWLMPMSMTASAGLDHVALQKARPADGDEHGVGAARVGRDRARQMVAHGHGRAFGH
jgi:hypothetical protein